MTVTSFVIELDRSNGVYHAGEVVRGKVKLVTSADIKTRGVRVRFQGIGHMHFHTTNGKHRHDYYGTKVFEEHRYTMFGNYYNTTILDNAGTNAYFGAAGGDGIMYIPCNEGENLSLIVRVMDYDFGKKDDLLGEIVLDTNKLIASGEATSFPLTRRGGHEKGEVTLSAQIIPMKAIFPASNGSDALSKGFGYKQGHTYNAVCQLRAHQATGLRKADFLGKNDVYIQAYRAPSNLDRSKALPEPDRDTVLPAGTLEFPFTFRARADAPGSAELGVGDASYIRYSLYANIDIAWWKDPSVRRVITILPSRPLPSPSLLRAIEYKCNQPMSLSSCCLCPCFSIGNTTIHAKLGRQAFAAGERLDFHLRVSNNTSEELDVKTSIVCVIQVQEHTGYGRCGYYETQHPLHSTTVQPGTVLEMGHDSTDRADRNPTVEPSSPLNNKSKDATLFIPTLYPSFNGATGLAGAVCEPVIFAYSVIFTVSSSGSCGTSRSVSFPVVICAAPPTASALRAVRAGNSSLSTIQQATPEGGSAFSLAYSTSYAPSATDDVAPGGEVVALGGSVATYIHEEDSAAVASSPYYQPYTLTYPVATPVLPDVGHHHSAAAANAKDTVASLIDSLHRGGSDLRATIRAWASATDINAVHNLSPESLQRVLQSVSSSMDQVAVAHELAQLIYCSCAHVVAAVQVCSFFKTEIASGMAAYVRDADHKSAVLELLPSYDREKVDVKFAKA